MTTKTISDAQRAIDEASVVLRLAKTEQETRDASAKLDAAWAALRAFPSNAAGFYAA